MRSYLRELELCKAESVETIGHYERMRDIAKERIRVEKNHIKQIDISINDAIATIKKREQ